MPYVCTEGGLGVVSTLVLFIIISILTFSTYLLLWIFSDLESILTWENEVAVTLPEETAILEPSGVGATNIGTADWHCRSARAILEACSLAVIWKIIHEKINK